MTNNNKLLSFIRRHRTIFFSTASLALTAALTTLAVTTGLVTAAVPTDDYSAAEPALSATATDTAEPYSGADSTLYGSVNLSPALPDTPRTTVSTEGATARLDATAPDLEYGGGSLQYLAAAEPEGDYFAVTFKTHGYSGTQDYPTKIYFGGYSYDDNAGNGEANTHYTMADGDVLTRYILKTQYYRSYDLKAYCPFATIESYKVYATDDPSIVYTDEESDEYKSFIERAKWSSNAYLSFRNTDKVNITIEVTYGKSFNNVYFSTPTPINTYTGTASGMILGCFIRGNSTYNSYTSVSFNDSEFISVQKGGELRLRTNNNYYLIKNLKAYKRSADGVKGEEIPLTLTTEKTSYNSIEEYTFTMPEDSDIIFECDALYYRTYLNVNSDGKLFLNPSDSAPTIISTNGGDPEKSTRLSFAQYISAGYEYKITYNDRLNRSKLTRGVLSYTDLDGNAQEEAFEAVDGTITFTMPFVMNPTTSNQTVLTLYCDDSNLKNLDIVTDTVYKGRIKLSDAQGEYSISIYANRGTKGFNANTYNSFNYSLSDNSYTNYDLCAGRKYTVEDIYSYYQGKRLVYNGIEIFKKDADGNVTDEKVEVTDNGDGTYSFVMPECDIQLKPLYYDKLHCFTVENNQSGFGSSTIAPTDSSDGQSYLFDSNGLSVNNSTRKSITVNSYGIRTYTYILEDGTYTLSHQLTNDTAYRVKSVKAYKPYINSSGTQNCYIVTKDNVIQNEPYEDELQAQIITDNGDGTYTIKVPDSFSEKQNAVIYTELEYFTENYTDINYTVSQNCFYAAPPTALEGYFQDNTGKRSKTFSSNSETNATLSTLKNQDIDFSLNRGGYQAVYTPLTVTVTNAETGEVVARVEYLNEEYEFVEGVEDEFLSAPVTTYSNNGDGTKTKNNIKFTMHFADYPINLAVETSEAYAPLIINQYKVDAQGNASPVTESDGFTTKIQAAIHGGYSNVSAERLPQLHSKFFTEDGSAYNQSFDVNGASYSCKYIVPVNIDTGRVAVSAIPKAADGYMLSGIDAVALDRFGTVVTSNSAYWYEPTKAGVWYTTAYTTYGTDGNSYLCTTGYRSGYHNPSEQLVINVYYAEKASLTVNQIIEGFVNEASWTELANVKVEDYIEPRENTKPFLSDDKGVIDTLTYSISGRTAHTKEDELNIWSNTCGVTPGTGVKLTVTPKGAKKIQSFAAYTMNNGERTDILHTLVSGTGFPGTETVYLLDDEVSAGDDIFVDITYEEAQTLKLDVRMLDDKNNVVQNTTGASVTVTGSLTTGTEQGSDIKAFLKDGATERIDSFTTSTTDKVYAFSNTKISVDTALDDSGYVIANVVAYEMNDSGKEITSNKLNLSARKIEAGDTELQSAAIDLSHCEMSSLPVSKNAIIVVYLAKKSTMTVSVYTANDAGEYELGNNTGDSGSYINITSNNSLIGYNPYAIVTSSEEGNYNTDSFTLTNNPPSRTASIIQGSYISAFAQLPYDAEFVVSKIVVRYKNAEGEIVKDPSAYCNGIYTYTDSITQTKYLRVSFGSNARIMPNRDDYDVRVYLMKAKRIHSKVTLTAADGGQSRADYAGYAYIYGKNNTDTEVTAPFSTNASSSYDAISTSTPYIRSVRCVRDTELSFKVRPTNQNFYIGSVSAHLGSEDGAKIKLTESEPDSNRYITYTLVNDDGSSFRMPSLNDVYINIQFYPKTTSQIKLDYTYTDDYQTFKPLTGDMAKVTVSGSNSNEAFKDLKVFTDRTGAQANSFELASGESTAEYTALAGSSIRISGAYREGRYYLPYIAEITDEKSQSVSRGLSFNTAECSVSLGNTIADKTYNIRVVLVPAAMVSVAQFENNRYKDTPEDVMMTNRAGGMQIAEVKAVNANFSKPMANGSSFTNSFKASPNSAKYLVAVGTELTVSFNNNSASPGYLENVTASKNLGSESESYVIKQGEEDGIVTYALSESVTADSKYQIYAYYDCIDVLLKTNYSPVNAYLVTSKEIDGSKVDVNNSDTYTSKITLRNMSDSTEVISRLPEESKKLTDSVYFILEKNTPDDEVALKSASWQDYRDKVKRDIKDILLRNMYSREYNGITKYYYWYQVYPAYESGTPLDNSMDFVIEFTTEKPPVNPDPPKDPTDSKVTVTQFERTSNTGYVETTNGKTKVSLANPDAKFTYNGGEVSGFDVPVDAGSGVLLSSASAVTKTGETVVLDITPPDKYIVSRVEAITDSGVTYTVAKKGGVYKASLGSGIVNINVYFSQPLVTISTNNTVTASKGTVSINGTEIIDSSEFMDSTLVNAGDSKTLVISPLTYTKDSVEYRYRVSYVLMGDSRNSMALIDPTLISTDEETGVTTVTLDNISKDIDLHIQFAGEEEEKTALLIVSHHIKIGEEYEDSVYGKVVTTGTLTGNDSPIYLSDGTACSGFALTKEKTLTATVVTGASLDFDVTPPDNYAVDKITGRFTPSTQSETGETLVFTRNGSKYTLSNAMPDSGVIYVDVYYAIPTVTNELTVAKKISADNLNSGIADEVKAKLADSVFGFKLQQNGSPYADKAYTLTKADNTQESKATDASGVFNLKPSFSALFGEGLTYNDPIVISESMPDMFSFDTSYAIRDLIADAILKQDSGAEASFGFVNSEQNKLKDARLYAEFTNALSVSDLTLDMNLYKSDGTTPSDKAVPFDFTVELDLDGNGAEYDYQQYALEYKVTSGGAESADTLTATDGKLSITPSQTAKLINIPVGAGFKITESAKTGYELIGASGGAVSGNTVTGVVGTDNAVFNNKALAASKGLSAVKYLDGNAYSGSDFSFNAELVKVINIPDVTSKEQTELDSLKTSQAYTSTVGTTDENGSVVFKDFTSDVSDDEAARYVFKIKELEPSVAGKYSVDSTVYYAYIDISGGEMSDPMYSANETLSNSSAEAPKFYNTTYITTDKYTDIVFTKLDENGSPLGGAQFTLYTDESCETEATKENVSKTDSAFENPAESVSADGEDKGKVTFSDVRYNPTSGATYYFKETKAPSGYQLMNGIFRVEINSDGSCSISRKAEDGEYEPLTDSSITNLKLPEFPLAGGTGTAMLYVLGTIAVLGAAAAFVIYRKRSLVIAFAKKVFRNK